MTQRPRCNRQSAIGNLKSEIQNPQSPHPSSGFTLLECLTALIILSIGLVGVFALFAAGAVSHKKGVDQTTAGIFAQKVLTELQAKFTDETIDALAGRNNRTRTIALKDQADPELPGLYKYDLTLQAFDNRREAYAATLRVKWLERGVEQAAVFETVLLRKLDR